MISAEEKAHYRSLAISEQLAAARRERGRSARPPRTRGCGVCRADVAKMESGGTGLEASAVRLVESRFAPQRRSDFGLAPREPIGMPQEHCGEFASAQVALRTTREVVFAWSERPRWFDL